MTIYLKEFLLYQWKSKYRNLWNRFLHNFLEKLLEIFLFEIWMDYLKKFLNKSEFLRKYVYEFWKKFLKDSLKKFCALHWFSCGNTSRKKYVIYFRNLQKYLQDSFPEFLQKVIHGFLQKFFKIPQKFIQFSLVLFFEQFFWNRGISENNSETFFTENKWWLQKDSL